MKICYMNIGSERYYFLFYGSFSTAQLPKAWVVKRIQCRISCKALLVLVNDLPCLLYQPRTTGVMDLYGGGEEIEGLHCGLHSD